MVITYLTKHLLVTMPLSVLQCHLEAPGIFCFSAEASVQCNSLGVGVDLSLGVWEAEVTCSALPRCGGFIYKDIRAQVSGCGCQHRFGILVGMSRETKQNAALGALLEKTMLFEVG